MRIFLAGATGAVGRELLPLLLDRGHQVTALCRTDDAARRLRAQGADAAVADVFDADALDRVVRAAEPEGVMHQLTALSGGNRAENSRIRMVGTRHLVDAALAAGVRRIVAQSVSWAQEAGTEPAVEDEPLDLNAPEPRLNTVSGVQALELTVRQLPEWVVLRYGTFYGPGTWYTLPDGPIAAGARAGEFVADADVLSFVHVRDAAAAAVDALEWPSGVVNICDDEPAPGHVWLPVYCAAAGAEAPRLDTTTPRQGWARGASNHYARKHLGWTPQYPSWRTGFTEPPVTGA